MNEDWPGKPILATGRNCALTASASRLAVLIDSADYFSAFAAACQAAEQQILILGWDFDRHEKLHRDPLIPPHNDQLGAFLIRLVKKKPKLNLYLLPWDFNLLYATERELLPALQLRLQLPARFHFRLDGRHPKGASHHQKIVVIDDQLAFLGGIDLTRWRWDTCEHKAIDHRRVDPNGNPYPPFHDMMWMLEGDIAARLGDLARERWHRAGGRKLSPPAPVLRSAWPAHFAADLTHQVMGLARTEPAYAGRAPVREIRQCLLDAIAAANDFIYLENQYLTARCVTNALGKRLMEVDGPDIVIILPRQTRGWLEKITMDVLRSRLIKHLRQADTYQRLRLYYPHQPGLGDDCINVHAKLLIVDDRLLRIGSANLSARSMGLDTECDGIIESWKREDATHDYIRSLRRRLLAEHLGCLTNEIAKAEEKQRLIAAIEQLRHDGRSLRPLDYRVPEHLDELIPDAGIIDPPEPFSGDYFVAQYVPRRGRGNIRRRTQIFLSSIVFVVLVAISGYSGTLPDWTSPSQLQQCLTDLPTTGSGLFLLIIGIAVAAMLMVPLTLLALIAGFIFPGWAGISYLLSGVLLGALLSFGIGRYARKQTINRLTGKQRGPLSQRLGRHGTIGVAVLRLVPIAPFSPFNLIAGSSRLSVHQFLLGSFLGLAPSLIAIMYFSTSLIAAIQAPTIVNLSVAALVTAALILSARLIKRWLRAA